MDLLALLALMLDRLVMVSLDEKRTEMWSQVFLCFTPAMKETTWMSPERKDSGPED